MTNSATEDPPEFIGSPWMGVAIGELGVAELAGAKHARRIIEYHATTVLHAQTDEIAWCSSFVCWCLHSVAVEHTRAANARSYLKWGKPVSGGPEALYGAIAVFKRDSAGPSSGHVGFYVGVNTDRTSIAVLGGNQSNRVSVALYAVADLLDLRRPL